MNPSPGKYVLGIDIGTSAAKVAAVSTSGALVASASAEFPTYSPHPGWTEQDPLDWLSALIDSTRRVLSDSSLSPSDIAALSLSSAAHIAVLLDERDRPTRRAILWNDQRTSDEAGALEDTLGDEIFRTTFQKVSTTWTLPHLIWIRRYDGDAWRRMRRIMLSKDFVLYRLTGESVTDPATALSSLLYDPSARAWSELLMNAVELDPSLLPRVLPPTAVAGKLTPEAAAALGLLPGTPIVNGSLDSACETLGAGVNSPGQCLLRLASAGGIHLVTPEPRPHPALITYPHPIEPLWYCQAGTSSCASAVRWALAVFTAGKSLPFSCWDTLALDSPPGAEGLLFHPYLAGERAPHWDPHLKASFTGATLRHSTAHFARAVYEGTAFSLRDALAVIRELADLPPSFTAVGGGTQSGVWLQIIADVLARPIDVPYAVDSSFGAALIGLVALGCFPSLRDAAPPTAGSLREPRRILPVAENVPLYDRLFASYTDLHRRLAPFYAPQSSDGSAAP